METELPPIYAQRIREKARKKAQQGIREAL